jgi:hypothetical protein
MDIRPVKVYELFTFSGLICLMAPRRAVEVGICVTFVIGIILAGYDGTAIYVWYTTGKVEILGALHDRAYSPLLYSKSLAQNFSGFAVGAFLLILVPFELAIFLKALRRRNAP